MRALVMAARRQADYITCKGLVQSEVSGGVILNERSSRAGPHRGISRAGYFNRTGPLTAVGMCHLGDLPFFCSLGKVCEHVWR
jgi:hypothetical protein